MHYPSEITNIAYHTKDVRPGSLFVAIRGATVDGHALISDAVSAGARVVVAEEHVDVPANVVLVVVSNTRQVLGACSAAWFGDPTRELQLIGITGTNGKTTTAYLLESIWRAAKRKPGVMGTINYRYGDVTMAAPTTTPQSYDVQSICRQMVNHGVTDLAMEVSSHGLVQYRVDACQFNGAVFTNLSQDHLDYHDGMADYAKAKNRLFQLLDPEDAAFAIAYRENPVAEDIVAGCRCPVTWYGLTPEADIYPETWETTLGGITMTVKTPHNHYTMQSPLMGQFNVLNVLAAVGVGDAMGISAEAIQSGVAQMACVPGRMERVAIPHDFTVIVDYAHTPDALRSVLTALRPLTRGRLITVFGCGGDRDQAKRPMMGRVVAELSDVVVVTSDNPRTEDPKFIIQQIWEGMADVRSASDGDAVIVAREEAIRHALSIAQANDIVLIAGKGHEDYQIIGTEKRHFDDREEVKKWI